MDGPVAGPSLASDNCRYPAFEGLTSPAGYQWESQGLRFLKGAPKAALAPYGGRLILGLGAGFHDPEYLAFGYPIDHRYGRFEEAIRIIHGLLRDLILSQPVNDKWISVLQHGMGGHSSIMGYGPERFSFRENKAIIGCEARLVQPIIDHFKDWLPRANTVYEETVERDAQRAEEAERKQLQQRLAEGRFQARPCNGWELLRLHQPYQSSPDQSDFPELVASWMARTIRRGPERVSIRPARDPRCARALTGQGVMTSSCSPAWSPHHGRRIIQ